MTTAYTDTRELVQQLDVALGSMRVATGCSETIADWRSRSEYVDVDTMLDRLEQLSLLNVRMLAAAMKAHTRFADDLRELDRRDRITHELLHTAASAARQFNATLADISDEHRTMP